MDIKFGTDGWRGVMARDFTFQNVRKVAQAIADYMKNLPPKASNGGRAVIGFDRRFQSEAFAAEIARILQGNRLKPVLFSETLPTPAVSFMTQKLKALGVMVTASHNPPAYNGVKIKVEGRAAPETITQAVEGLIDKGQPMRDGDVTRQSFRKEYISWLKSRVSSSKLAKIKKPVVVDYMYGCASGLLEEVFKSKKLITLHSRRDPTFGGLHPEPIEKYLKELSERVKQEKALIGIAFDGDADRIGIVDDHGRYITPCQVFPMIADYLIDKKGIKGKIVQSVSMGYLAGRIAKAHNFPFEELPVGFKHVGEKLAIGEAVIGGEESGGYAWKGVLPERDGLLAGLLMLEMCADLNKTPSQILGEIEKKYGKSFFQRVDVHLNKPIADKHAWMEKIKKRLPKKILGAEIKSLIDIDGLKIIMDSDHWLLIRPSGTEPLMRAYAESDSAQRTQALLDFAKKWTH